MAAARFPAGTPAQEEATMVRGFSHPFLPPIASRARIPAQFPRARDGGGAIRAGGQSSCEGGASFWGDDFPGSKPKLTPPSPERGRVEGKREGTPPSGRFWMELEGGRG